jgi:chorismate mutase/prephenate dehydratase
MLPGPEVQAVREEIEDIDRQLLALLKARMSRVELIARSKLQDAYPFRDPGREEQVLRRVRHLAVGSGLDPHAVEKLYRQILEMSIAHQRAHIQALETVPLRVAYQGVEGSYSHLTSQRRYAGRRGGVLLSGYGTIRQAVAALRAGEADVALLPIENSMAGSINETYDALAEGGLAINAEEISRVEHCLLGLPGARLEGLRKVMSHPQALAQCEAFLAGMPWLQAHAEFDTAGAAFKVKEMGDPSLAAIASESAARLFGLEILAKGIEMQSGNATRFVEVALHAIASPQEGPSKTSLVMTLDHSAGALGQVLTEFGRRGLQVAKIESRPMQTDAWRYRFYIDVEAHADAPPMAAALESIRPHTAELRLLGTYPRAERSPQLLGVALAAARGPAAGDQA